MLFRLLTMKTFIVSCALLSLAAFNSSANAGTATGLTKATATLASFCSMTAQPINFGNVAGPTNNQYSSQSNVSVLCTKNSSYTITLNLGVNTQGQTTRNMIGAKSGQILNYMICRTPSMSGTWGVNDQCAQPWFSIGATNYYTVTGTGTGTSQSYPMYGVVQTGYYTPDNYSDTITATINY
jgi:spore coat protein U-like protein